MTTEDIQGLKTNGHASVRVALATPIRGCKQGVIANIQGDVNGNPNDLWLWSPGEKFVLARIYTGSKNMEPENLDILASCVLRDE